MLGWQARWVSWRKRFCNRHPSRISRQNLGPSHIAVATLRTVRSFTDADSKQFDGLTHVSQPKYVFGLSLGLSPSQTQS
jgi:hypothetical protein